MPDAAPPAERGGRRLRYRLEAAAVRAVLALFRRLGLDRASALGGAVARALGPRLPVSRRARDNLRRAFPEMAEAAREAVVREMWDNLGRTFAEYAHLRDASWGGPDGRVAVEGEDHLRAALAQGRGTIMVSGHFANWELLPLVAATLGVDVAIVYRRPNNPIVEAILDDARGAVGTRLPKGAAGARRMMAVARGGGHLALLADQKLNTGLAVPFFGRDAMTSPAAAELALRYGQPLLPAWIERTGGARFRVVIEPALQTVRGGDHAADVAALTRRLNEVLEAFVRRRPGQWLWLHRRWPD